MIYAAYFGGLVIILVNVLLITRTYRKLKLIATFLILTVSIGGFPSYHNYFTEAYPTDYDRLNFISNAIKKLKSDEAIALKNEITEATADKEVSIYEFNKISEKFDDLIKNDALGNIKQAVAQ